MYCDRSALLLKAIKATARQLLLLELAVAFFAFWAISFSPNMFSMTYS